MNNCSRQIWRQMFNLLSVINVFIKLIRHSLLSKRYKAKAGSKIVFS